jgi:PPP family 3-phenylpropionic acid transporter
MSRAAGLASLLPLVVLYAFFGSPIGSVMDNSVVTQLGDRKADYGRVRLWGSVGWGVSAFVMGPVLERAGLGWAFTGYLAAMAILFLYSFVVPIVGAERSASFTAGARVLARNGRFLGLMIMALVYGISIAMLLNYLFLHMSAMGASETLMAWTLVLATISEVPFLFLSGRIITRYGINRIIAVAFLLMAIRAFIYAFMPAPWWVLPVNLLLAGPTFALFWAGAVAEANRLAPSGLGATAQGALGSVMFGLGAAAGNFLGGAVFDRYGGAPLMQAVGWALTLTLVIFVALRLRPRRRGARLAVEER